jgi:hypothetical protein
LIDDAFLPPHMKEENIAKKYEYLRELYFNGNTYILLNNVSVFGPFPRPEVPWDISEAQKIATYDPEVTKVLTWIKTKIIINLSRIDYRTMWVLVRIATGMLNKCNIPKCIQIMFHDNMVENLRKEYGEIIMADLPF